MTDSTTYTSPRDFTKSVTIEVGQQLSTAVDTNGCELVGIRIDANLTGTKLTFKSGEALAGTYIDYYTNDSATPPLVKEVELTVSTTKQFASDREDFTSVQFLKIFSGTAQAGSDAVITLVLRP